jgi:hypothetical protein
VIGENCEAANEAGEGAFPEIFLRACRNIPVATRGGEVKLAGVSQDIGVDF